MVKNSHLMQDVYNAIRIGDVQLLIVRTLEELEVRHNRKNDKEHSNTV